jgi:hypothetical protein
MRLIPLGLTLLFACATEESVAATVYFAIDAPLCSSTIPVQFFIDSTMVGTDTFVVSLSPEHTRSRGFAITPGPHALGAQVVAGYVWPDTVVNLAAGEIFTDSLPFYCS